MTNSLLCVPEGRRSAWWVFAFSLSECDLLFTPENRNHEVWQGRAVFQRAELFQQENAGPMCFVMENWDSLHSMRREDGAIVSFIG